MQAAHVFRALSPKRPLATLLLSLALSSSASAADWSLRPTLPPLEPPTTYDWSGFYVGGQVGFAAGRDPVNEFLTDTGAFTGFSWHYHPNGATGGLHAGFNRQFGSFVLGVEGDAEIADLRGGFSYEFGMGQTRIDRQGSVRARIGYAIDRLLIYGTAGVVIADVKHRYTNPLGPTVETLSDTRTGATVGAGLEYAFTNAILGRVEYRYSNFGDYKRVSTVAFPGFTGEQSPSFHTVRIGLSYKF